MRLPAQPLLAVFERAARRQGYIGSLHDSTYPGLQAFAETLGLEDVLNKHGRRRVTFAIEEADRIAVRLNLHPILIWPAEYNAWLGEPDPPAYVREIVSKRRYRRGERYQRKPAPEGWRPCLRCGSNDRYADGHCRPCTLQAKSDKARVA